MAHASINGFGGVAKDAKVRPANNEHYGFLHHERFRDLSLTKTVASLEYLI